MTCLLFIQGGSSPLARGLLAPVLSTILLRGIIPARAGFTRRTARRSGCSRDHPRSRGVYTALAWRAIWFRGSSPLARGLRQDVVDVVVQPGIIPARAGFTGARRARPPPPADHPRSRGVYQIDALGEVDRLGSSPLARGLHKGKGPTVGRARIIPARAGFTRPFARASRNSQDHPRSRGVYGRGRATVQVRKGSSPLARGLRGAHDAG